MNVKDLIKAIDEQFVSFDKAGANTLIIKFSTMKLAEVRGVRDHIMLMGI
ncbi:pleiotropic drug resistance protein 1-like [Trifolium pratense]|uniref:Pleiotropic drug resistance protein 1-like n=1 Tax=Trifolium pratense TaxID=57577 RepID=A0A2K3LMS1_TRIPR|nr:pleiotropic drug resistance protein 1-like [Trifolium pratense]